MVFGVIVILVNRLWLACDRPCDSVMAGCLLADREIGDLTRLLASQSPHSLQCSSVCQIFLVLLEVFFIAFIDFDLCF